MDEQQQQEEQRTPCPRCSYFIELGPPEVDDKLKKDYVRSLYGSKPFGWTFEVQGVKFRFESLNRRLDRDKERVRKLMTRRAIDNKLIDEAAELLGQYDQKAAAELLSKKQEFNIEALDSTLSLIDAFYSLRGVEDSQFTPPEVDELDTLEHLVNAIEHRFGEMSREAITMIVQLSDLFEMMLSAAKESCLDGPFWKGAGLVPSLEDKQQAS